MHLCLKDAQKKGIMTATEQRKYKEKKNKKIATN
jgi:hypothetical protein